MPMYEQRAELLGLRETAPGEYRWVEERKLWLHGERQKGAALFSKIGTGARSVLFTLHPRPLTLHQAIRWRGAHYFLTGIDHKSPVRMEVSAAEVRPRVCTALRVREEAGEDKEPVYIKLPPVTFPAVLTEKYAGFVQDSPMARTAATYVLVTPKVIALEVGDLVQIEGMPDLPVRVVHLLEEYKNEYELYVEEDV